MTDLMGKAPLSCPRYHDCEGRNSGRVRSASNHIAGVARQGIYEECAYIVGTSLPPVLLIEFALLGGEFVADALADLQVEELGKIQAFGCREMNRDIPRVEDLVGSCNQSCNINISIGD